MAALNVLPPQFNIPLHPSCVRLSEGTKALGKLKILECKNLLNRFEKRKKTNFDAGLKKADEQVANGGSASEYIAYLSQLRRDRGNDY